MPVEAIWKNYDRLDSLGRGYVGNLVRFSRDGALGTALLKSAHICEYLPRWRIVRFGLNQSTKGICSRLVCK